MVLAAGILGHMACLGRDMLSDRVELLRLALLELEGTMLGIGKLLAQLYWMMHHLDLYRQSAC